MPVNGSVAVANATGSTELNKAPALLVRYFPPHCNQPWTPSKTLQSMLQRARVLWFLELHVWWLQYYASKWTLPCHSKSSRPESPVSSKGVQLTENSQWSNWHVPNISNIDWISAGRERLSGNCIDLFKEVRLLTSQLFPQGFCCNISNDVECSRNSFGNEIEGSCFYFYCMGVYMVWLSCGCNGISSLTYTMSCKQSKQMLLAKYIWLLFFQAEYLNCMWWTQHFGRTFLARLIFISVTQVTLLG